MGTPTEVWSDHYAAGRNRILVGLSMLAGCEGKSTSSRAEHPAAQAQEQCNRAIEPAGRPRGVGAAMRLRDSGDARRAREDSVSNAVP
jgi:hypothetical protein